MYTDRIKNRALQHKIVSAQTAASFIKDNAVVGSSGFTQAGDSKAVLKALAERALTSPLQITLITGASLGHGTDGLLTETQVLQRRLPFQVDPILRKGINQGNVLFVDQHLSETAEQLKSDNLPPMDIAIIEAAIIEEDGSIVPTTSVGNSATFAEMADKIIIELNVAVPAAIKGLHDIFNTGYYPNHKIIPITAPGSRIGTQSIPINPAKVIGIVITDITDSPADIARPDAATTAIAGHLLEFFNHEIRKGRLSRSLHPLQAGIGKVANSVLQGFTHSNFEQLTMYSEVLQDSTFDLIDAGKLVMASGSSITVSQSYYHKVIEHLEQYKDKIILRPQDISNAAEVIRRLGIIAINTALECDIYGNVNSTHIGGTHMMNGIGGSGDFARNAYMSIFVTSSTGKNNSLSRIVPMVSHVDHTEHDVDIIVTENGLSDLRCLAPRERARVIIDQCSHPMYQDDLRDYFRESCKRGGQTPHLLENAFSLYARLRETGSMQLPVAQPEWC